jgi:hypothetical protein
MLGIHLSGTDELLRQYGYPVIVESKVMEKQINLLNVVPNIIKLPVPKPTSYNNNIIITPPLTSYAWMSCMAKDKFITKWRAAVDVPDIPWKYPPE